MWTTMAWARRSPCLALTVACIAGACSGRRVVDEAADGTGTGSAEATTTSSTGSASADVTGPVSGDATGSSTDADSTTGDAQPELSLTPAPIKRFELAWEAVGGADHYQLLESPSPGEPFVPLASAIVGESYSLVVPLHLRHEASYVLQACDAAGCTDAAATSVTGTLAAAVGYVKASHAGEDDRFGEAIALSGDGSTLVVGAPQEDGGSAGIDGDQTDDSAPNAGAVYVLVRDAAGQWSQQAYLKASNPEVSDAFGRAVALSHDGRVLAIGAPSEDGGSTGIDGDQADDSAPEAGAVYVLVRDAAGQWSQQAYLKASNPDAYDDFGTSVALSHDGRVLAVGAPGEASQATGVGGDQADDTEQDAGAVYLFERDAEGPWVQQAYVKASNTEEDNRFGHAVALSDDARTLAVGAPFERSLATGIDGNQAQTSEASGAVYMLARDAGGPWVQQAYVKASNASVQDQFGRSLALSHDGSTLAVGAPYESSAAFGIDGDQASDGAERSGAVYVLVRDAAGEWSQQAYVKASNTGDTEHFGESVTLSDDGLTLAVGAYLEDGAAIGIGGDQSDLDEAEFSSGAVYVLARAPMEPWSHRAYVKAPNTGTEDRFGSVVALAGDASTLAVGAPDEDGSAVGRGEPFDESAPEAGAVYLY